MKLKITSIGNSAGVILPKELMARLRVDKGDELYAVETPDGIRLTTYDPTLAAQSDETPPCTPSVGARSSATTVSGASRMGLSRVAWSRSSALLRRSYSQAAFQ